VEKQTTEKCGVDYTLNRFDAPEGLKVFNNMLEGSQEHIDFI
jgi:hypothetical protein